ncbi:MAG: adenylate/guanylate cyclase domain-containing protein [Myxococcales bacterium]
MNLVLLVTDMKGFTARTATQTREENARMLALHGALLLEVMKGYGGWKVKEIGDALLAAFKSPTDAVLCAMAMQDRLGNWNARAPLRDQIEVRIAVSQGEMRRQNGDLHGEPLQLVLEANALAQPGEVVLTDAVYLSMAKSEAAPAEVFRELPLGGGGRIRLRRAVRGPDRHLPYGGRALNRLGRLPDPAFALRVRTAIDAALDVTRRKVIWAAAALLLVAAAAGEHGVRQDPVERAVRLLQAREPLAALAELDRLADSTRASEPRVEVLRGKAEHALGKLGLSFADFASAAQQDPLAIDDGAIAALCDQLDAETFPVQWRPALVRLLGEKVGRRGAPFVRHLLASSRAASRNDALDVLELSGAATDADRLAAAAAELSDPHAACVGRKSAVRRLALVTGARAESLLTSAASSKECGSAEARDVLRRRKRSPMAAAN